MVLLALLLAGASISAYQAGKQRTIAEQEQTRTRAILNTSATLKVEMLNSVRGERGYVITGNDEFLLPHVLSRPVLEENISQLKVLTSTVDDQQMHVNSITLDLQRFMAWQAKVIALQRSGQHDAAVTMIATGDGRRAVENILDELRHVEVHSEESLALYAESAANYTRSNEIYQYGLTLFGFLLLFISITAATAMRRSAEAEAEAREELRRRAMTDDLTGLANRRELLASLERAIAAARRNRRPLALALLDIDHFKRVNDLHGHPAGDAVIRRIALLAVDVMRGQDTVGRLGGEEFAIVLPDCSAEDAMAACERLCEEVRTTDLEMETGANLFITLSTGVTVFERNDSAESMIARADAALYAAKHGGRNQVKLAA